jgi:LuxR family transcriptional regulator, maltose regulon positive regulatory protein
MNDVIARTKITPPRHRPDLLTRKRLVDLFSDLLNHPLILLVAPAGYGKTCALIDFIHSTAAPVCWLALDALDRDSYRCFASLIASISQRFPSFAAPAHSALQSYIAGQNQLEQFVTTLANELYGLSDEDYLIIVDDYHLAAENDEISTFFSQFVQQIDERCHVLLAARRLFGLPDLPLLVARGYVSGLDFEDLAFSEDELQQLVLRNYGQTLSDGEAADLVKVTEGWITGLLLSAQSRLRNIPERVRRLRAAGIDLYDYLAQQVLDQQPDELREFLLRSSVLEEFDSDLCNHLLDAAWLPAGSSWQSLIDEVLARNLFAVAVGDDGSWVRYHHLFQEFLHKQLVQEYPDDETLILQRMAAFYADQKEWEKAHRYYQKLGDLPATAALIERAGPSLLQRGRFLLLAAWLDSLPQELLQNHSNLLSIQGDALARKGEVQQALLVLDRAQSALKAAGDQLDLAQTLVRRAIVYRLLGDYPHSLADSDQALALLGANEDRQRERLAVKAHALLSKGMSLLATGQFPESIAALKEAMQINQMLDDVTGTATVAMELAITYGNGGYHAQALELFQFCLETQRSLASVSGQATVLNNLGVLYHLQGAYVQALRHLEEAEECARRSGYTRLVGFTLASIGDLFADLDLWQIAQRIYRQAWTVAQRVNERFLIVYLELALAKMAGATGAWYEAFEHLSTVSKLVLDKNSNYEWALYQLAMGRYYLAQHKANEAIAPLEDALVRFAEGDLPTEEALTHFLLASAYQAAAEATQAAAHLTRGLAGAFTLESRHPLIVGLQHLSDVIIYTELEGVAREQAKHLAVEIRAFEHEIPTLGRQLRQSASPTLTPHLLEVPPRLIIHTLGRAEVIMDGKGVTTREWQTQISRDIFLCLVAHPQGLTKEEVGGIFWPDATPNELKTRFKNALYRLRSALHPEVIFFDDEIYRFNRAFDYEYDVERFLSKVAEGDTAPNPTLRIAAYEAAIPYYSGAYLPEVDGAWIWAEREHLHRVFTDTILTLAELQLAADDYRAALQSCQRALADDPCLEEAHRLAMRAYAALGNRAAVARQYAVCQQALRDEIDVPPSPQTEELYTLLMHA